MISTVSICGVDDSVAPEDLAEISAKYPFVEWGINLSSNTSPRPTYPSDIWLESLKHQSDKLRIRGILHGRWERDMLNGNLSLREERPDIWDTLQRVQIDTRLGYTNLIDALCLIPDKEVILVSKNYKDTMGLQLNAFPLFTDTSLLYSRYCGYVMKENEIEKMKSLEFLFWVSIDGFRHSNGITMDLLRVERFLDKIENFITPDNWFKALLETNQIKKRFSIAEGFG